MTDKQMARQKIHDLMLRLENEAFGIPEKEVELLDQVIALCDEHGLTHHNCFLARKRLDELGEHADRVRQKKS
jgi:hypothetical protein